MTQEITQEQKELLLKDLCTRLPYGVKCKYYDCCEGEYDEGTICGFERQEWIQIDGKCIYVEEVKPYLFPLSSMNEVQKNIYSIYINELKQNTGIYFEKALNSLQFWLYANHFDVNNLIPMGLAINAVGLNIY